MQLEDLRVLVTGGARGIGRYTCLALVRAGARVAALDVNGEGLEELAAEAQDLGGEIYVHQADVAREDQVREAVAAAAKALGYLNGLINNAGIYRDGLLVKRTEQGVVRFPLSQWRQVLDVDLTGTFLCTREVAAHMVAEGVRPGVIVNISSISRYGNPGQSNYAAAKAGVVADTVVWARELARYGIRVGAIAPGLIRTPILDQLPPEKLNAYLEAIPLRRLGEPEEIFAGIRFIVECDYFTGRCLDIDGGFAF